MLTKFRLPVPAALACLLFAAGLDAHPMGNFSVNHYSRIELRTGGARLTYILDLAEVPTFELLAQWGRADTPLTPGHDGILTKRAGAQAREWLGNVQVTVDGQSVTPQIASTHVDVSEGAGGLPVLRVTTEATITCAPGSLTLTDRNYPQRTGWKEIVIRSSESVTITRASHMDKDVSHALTEYPAQAGIVPPQDLAASVQWTGAPLAPPVAANSSRLQPSHPVALAAAQHNHNLELPTPAPTVAPQTGGFAAQQKATPGTVVRGDFLSRFLRAGKFGPLAILMGLLAAFGLGAIHALSPGHGKALVAAYLVGSRGTLRHALLLGLTVMLTHTISVFVLGIGVLYFQSYFAPERIVPVLATLSGASLIAIGAWLFSKRLGAFARMRAHQRRHHQHAELSHSHDDLQLDHAHGTDSHTHADGPGHTHSHGGSTHTHALPEGPMSLAGLIALGASGGMVPCPSALILLLGAIALRQTAVGLVLLAAFSAGLAVVLMAIGAAVVYAKDWIVRPTAVRDSRVLLLLPVMSSVAVMIIGILMTLSGLGWMRPLPFLS